MNIIVLKEQFINSYKEIYKRAAVTLSLITNMNANLKSLMQKNIK